LKVPKEGFPSKAWRWSVGAFWVCV